MRLGAFKRSATDPGDMILGQLSPVAEEPGGTPPNLKDESAKDPSKKSNEMKEAYRSVKKS